MRRVRAYLVGPLLLGFLATGVAAQIYRWVDDKGTIHFTDERPRNRSGVKEVVEAGARRTPMVRGGPEWRVDTPTPALLDRTGRRDDFYDDYGDEGTFYDVPQQGDTFIEVYEPPPWFDWKKHQRHGDRRRKGDRGPNRHRGFDASRGREHGRSMRSQNQRLPSGVSPPAIGEQSPPVARPRRRAASRALPLPR